MMVLKTVYSDGRITVTARELLRLAESPGLREAALRGRGGDALVLLVFEARGEKRALRTVLPKPEAGRNYRFKVSLAGARPGDRVMVLGVRELKVEDITPLRARLEKGSLEIPGPGRVTVGGAELEAQTKPVYLPRSLEVGVEASLLGERIRVFENGRATIALSTRYRSIVAAEFEAGKIAITYDTPAGKRTRVIIVKTSEHECTSWFQTSGELYMVRLCGYARSLLESGSYTNQRSVKKGKLGEELIAHIVMRTLKGEIEVKGMAMGKTNAAKGNIADVHVVVNGEPVPVEAKLQTWTPKMSIFYRVRDALSLFCKAVIDLKKDFKERPKYKRSGLGLVGLVFYYRGTGLAEIVLAEIPRRNPSVNVLVAPPWLKEPLSRARCTKQIL